MSYLKWSDSPHFNRNKVIKKEVVPNIELPKLMRPYTRHQISDAIKDDPRFNAINPSNQAHIINIAIDRAQKSGMLIEDIKRG